MPKVMTLDEIVELNPHIEIAQVREWQDVSKSLSNERPTGRFRRMPSGRDVRVHIDDSAENDPRIIKLHKY